jgi:hypothetical protein
MVRKVTSFGYTLGLCVLPAYGCGGQIRVEGAARDSGAPDVPVYTGGDDAAVSEASPGGAQGAGGAGEDATDAQSGASEQAADSTAAGSDAGLVDANEGEVEASSDCSSSEVPCRTLVKLADAPGSLAIAVDSMNVYYGGCLVSKLPLNGGMPISFTDCSGYYAAPNSFVVDATSIYWAGYAAAGVVGKAPLGGGSLTFLATNQSYP